MSNLEGFTIKKLHGYKNYNLKFKDNTLILVGENGAGKTTILRMLYYVISSQWSALAKINFEIIFLKVNGKKYSIKRTDITRKFSYADKKYLLRLPVHIRKMVMELLDNNNNMDNLPEIQLLCSRYNIPIHRILGGVAYEELEPEIESKDNNFKKAKKELKALFSDIQVLYLPTYRRIEQELSTIFKDIDEDDIRTRQHFINHRRNPNYTELIEFGMRDVDRSINSSLEALKEFARESLNTLTLGYLGDVVDQKYEKLDIKQIKEASDEIITSILERIDSKILSERSKKHLSKTIENIKKGDKPNVHAKVICHYFIKLLNFQQELNEKEYRIQRFCDVCNSYMEDKYFQYTSSSFSFSILPKKNINGVKSISTDQLSSGEKQIVSLFSHLYLSNNKNYFVMIDEPELSLSVTWQRQFLVDIKQGDFCTGLVAVTHSPFIYENKLDKYAHGLGEFLL